MGKVGELLPPLPIDKTLILHYVIVSDQEDKEIV